MRLPSGLSECVLVQQTQALHRFEPAMLFHRQYVKQHFSACVVLSQTTAPKTKLALPRFVLDSASMPADRC